MQQVQLTLICWLPIVCTDAHVDGGDVVLVPVGNGPVECLQDVVEAA